MRRLYPLTPEEQDFAERNFYLVSDFLSYHRLPEADYYDIVIFGFLESVQKHFRKPCAPECQNFPALARVNMRWAICEECRRQSCENRRANRDALSLDNPLTDNDENFTLFSVLADETRNPAALIEEHDAINQILSVGTESEREVIKLLALEYKAAEIGAILGITISKVWRLTLDFRHKARMKRDEQEIVSATTGSSYTGS